MGVHRYLHFISNNRNLKRAIGSRFPQKISAFLIDANGVIHQGKSEVYSKTKSKDKDKLEKKHIKFVIDKLKEILIDFHPEDVFVLAIDGLAVLGKQNQQKSRRYKASHVEPGTEGYINPELFQGNSISPGTDFMFKLDTAIKKWLKEEQNLPPKVIYSSHLNPGEGEHTCFDMIRAGHIDMESNVVLYGADSDLVNLSLLSSLRNIYLSREDKSFIYDINKLRKEVMNIMCFGENKNQKIYIQDYIVLTFMIGNDFLHKLPLLHDTNNSMNFLIQNYKNTKLYLTNHNGKIEWKNLLKYWKNLENFKIENYDLYQFNIRQPLPYMYKEYTQATTIRDTLGVEVDENFDSSKHVIDFDKKYFTKLWYDKQFKPRTEEMLSMFKNQKYFDKEDIIQMCKYYLKVLEWNLEYYLNGHEKVSKNLFYPYFYSPMLLSLINYLEFLITNNELKTLENKLENDEIDHSVIHQLMLIMPPQSKDLIPEPFRKLYLTKLQSISPIDFITLDPEGTDKDHVKTAIIPPINPYLVTKVINDSGIEIPEKYKNDQLLIIEKEDKSIKSKYIKYKFNYEIPQKYLF